MPYGRAGNRRENHQMRGTAHCRERIRFRDKQGNMPGGRCESGGGQLPFGSRDGLYLAVLENVQQYLVGLQQLIDLYESDLAPRQKMEKLIDFLAGNAFRKNEWQISVWVREVMNPSPMLEKIFQKEALPKISVIVKIFSEYTGYTADDPRLCSGIITLAAPFAVCLLGRHHSLRREMPVHIPIETMAENIKQLALANLENLKRNKR